MNRNYWIVALIKAALVALVLMPATPQKLTAQDCGSNCGFCATGKKEGYSYIQGGEYNMDCLTATTGCVKCGASEQRVKDAAPAPAALLKTLRTMPIESLERQLPALKSRLLVHPGRNIVAVRGEGCQSDAVAALAFLPRERIELLARSGVAGLEAFLEQPATTTK